MKPSFFVYKYSSIVVMLNKKKMRVSAILFFMCFVLDAATSLTDHGAKTLNHGALFGRSDGSSTTTTHRSDGSGGRERKAYIVYMGDKPENGTPAMDHHHNLLVNAIGEERIARESMIHSYGKSFNAFAAKLLPHEAERLKDMEGVVSVFPSKIHKLHTSRSWDFLGMPMTVKRNNLSESNVIVGLLDTGIYMQSESFKDEGYGPPPAKWKGKCQTGPNFPSCNNKVVGARYYNLDPTSTVTEPLSPEDTDGHGTHTASTVAGNPISGDYYGLAKGIARGGVPSARLAIYKVCGEYGCSELDILAALDDAIHDGVDVLSISLGGAPREYYEDVLAIGSFHAMRKGIFTACSAGNNGPNQFTVVNAAPWIMTVAANSIDRWFLTDMKLGNGLMVTGSNSINTFSPEKEWYPLISGTLARNASFHHKDLKARFCDDGTLDGSKVKGKIVYCFRPGVFSSVGGLQAAGTIRASVDVDTPIDEARDYALPEVSVDVNLDAEIDRYINTTRDPQAIIYKTRVLKQPAAPFLAFFSSRGPSVISGTILKPDVSAPGVNILASWTMLAHPTPFDYDKRYYPYNIISGTSMSCPHVAAAAAYIKSLRPGWSPAAIKSALMTTARAMNPDPKAHLRGDHLEGLGYGAGQIDPVKAVQPGLIYDLDPSSYIPFLCKEGYNETTIGLITGFKGFSCKKLKAASYDGLNYPSINVNLEKNQPISAVFERTVTNVGYPNSVYKATVKTPPGLSVTVIPDTLNFNKLHEKKNFKVVMKGPVLKGNDTRILQASLEWNDKWHKVRSPILVYRPDARGIHI